MNHRHAIAWAALCATLFGCTSTTTEEQPRPDRPAGAESPVADADVVAEPDDGYVLTRGPTEVEPEPEPVRSARELRQEIVVASADLAEIIFGMPTASLPDASADDLEVAMDELARQVSLAERHTPEYFDSTGGAIRAGALHELVRQAISTTDWWQTRPGQYQRSEFGDELRRLEERTAALADAAEVRWRDEEMASVEVTTNAPLTTRTDWAQCRGGPDRCNWRGGSPIVVPKVRWTAPASYSPAVVDAVIYAGGDSLRRMDLFTGRVLSRFRPEDPVPRFEFTGTPVVTADRVIAHATDGTVYALDRSLRKLIWSAAIDVRHYFSAASDGDVVVVASANAVLALSTDDGSVVWQHAPSADFSVAMSPAIGTDAVYFGTEQGDFQCLDLATGRVRWTAPCNEAFGWSDAVLAFGKAFVADRGGWLRAFDAKTGDLSWRISLGDVECSDLGVVPDGVVAGFETSVWVFDSATGRTVSGPYRPDALPLGAPLKVGDEVYVGLFSGGLSAFDAETAQLRWRLELEPGEQVFDPVWSEELLLIPSTRGLYAVERDGGRDWSGRPTTLRWSHDDVRWVASTEQGGAGDAR